LRLKDSGMGEVIISLIDKDFFSVGSYYNELQGMLYSNEHSEDHLEYLRHYL
jgi:hypothetical protein